MVVGLILEKRGSHGNWMLWGMGSGRDGTRYGGESTEWVIGYWDAGRQGVMQKHQSMGEDFREMVSFRTGRGREQRGCGREVAEKGPWVAGVVVRVVIFWGCHYDKQREGLRHPWRGMKTEEWDNLSLAEYLHWCFGSDYNAHAAEKLPVTADDRNSADIMA